MTSISFEKPEIMLPMKWDDSLQESTEVTRAALSLHSRADVVRLALRQVPAIIFEEVNLDSAVDAFSGEPNTAATAKVALLDAYYPKGSTQNALTRVSEIDVRKCRLAATLCMVELEDFAYAATTMFAHLESQTPGFRANAKATDAREDLLARQVLSQTDIQPGGEEDYRDYGRPDDE